MVKRYVLSVLVLLVALPGGCGDRDGEPSLPRAASAPTQIPGEGVKAVIHVLDGTVPDPNGRSEPLHAGGDVTEPFAIVSVLPDCRALAGAPIPVAVELVVTREGTVQSARILSAVPDSAKTLVLQSVRGWRFRPATFNGRTVAVTWTVTMKCA
jgi:TonB family protein